MGHFIVASKTKIKNLKLNQRLEESDFAMVDPSSSEFVQLKYIESDEEVTREPVPLKNGIWSIKKSMAGLFLQREEVSNDAILDKFVHTTHISDRIDQFFKKEAVYKKHGFDIAKRAILLWGPPGTGKTSTINKVIKKYVDQTDTAVVIWPTDQIEPYAVKQLFKSFDYKVKRVILVAEDLGGTEMEGSRMRSDASLLSLLDNQEKTFRITTLILATTNHPEMFLGNIANRPQRFDDKIEVGFPDAEQRTALLEFFAKKTLTQEEMAILKTKDAEGLTPAHLKEAIIRSDIYDQELTESLKQLLKEIENFKKAFETKKKQGFGMNQYD